MAEKKLKTKQQKLWVAFLGMLVLLNFPLLSIFNHSMLWFGIPLLYLYIFSVWAIVILYTFIIVERPFDIKNKQ